MTSSFAKEIGALDHDGLGRLAEDLTTGDGAGGDLARAILARMSDRPLERFEIAWDLSASEAAKIMGVSRQAYAKWRTRGVPPYRQGSVTLIDTATRSLVDHLRADRVATVVRRPAERLGGRSLLDLARAGDLAELADEAVAMFDLTRVQP